MSGPGEAGGGASGRLPFFVYGTLRPGGAHYGRELGGRTAAEEPAVLPGAVLYAGPGFPFAVRVPERPGALVRGALLWVPARAYPAVLARLDVLEGYAPGRHDNLYERVVARPLRRDGSRPDAWLYVAAPVLAARLRTTGRLLAGGDWFRPDGPPGLPYPRGPRDGSGPGPDAAG